jgi:hypothetical protein
MTRQVLMPTADISMVLPGTWANIPIRDERLAERIISGLVMRQVGRADRLAGVRREAKVQLRDVVARARAADVFQVALSLEILPGVPFPAAMFLDFQPWTGEPPREAERTARLVEMLPTADILDLESGLAARTWRQVRIRPGAEELPDTKLEYLMPTPEGEQLLRIHVDAPVECDPEMIVALFDAIVDSIRWNPSGVSTDVSTGSDRA